MLATGNSFFLKRPLNKGSEPFFAKVDSKPARCVKIAMPAGHSLPARAQENAMNRPLAAALFATLLLASGCASVATLAPGASQADVRARWGAPTVITKSAEGERWIYSTAPEGREVWLLDFDGNARLTRRTQGLTLERISLIQNGQQQSFVEALLGPSYYSLRYPYRPDELVHIYRFYDAQIPTCFYVGYDRAGSVTSTGMREEDRKSHLTGLTRPC
jgi:hypothetical protein